MRKAVLTALLAGLALAAAPARAAETALPSGAGQRLLVIAPHPDDETLGLGGLLQRALASGADIRILYLTNGESNEVASIFHQKRPLLWRSDFLKSGATRKKEALEAASSLGLRPDQLVFFGYPDGGLLNIWTRHWGSAPPFRSFFTRLAHVPYKDNFSFGRAFKGDEIVRDLERVLLSFQPTAVFVTAPFDLNPDHQAAFLYLHVALMNLREQLGPPAVHLYLIHAREWPRPEGLSLGEPLPPPAHIDRDADVRWNMFPLTAAQAGKKSETLLKYESQMAYKRDFLLAFARRNELYAQYPAERIAADPEPARADLTLEGASPGDVRYRIFGQELWIEIPLTNVPDEMGVLTSHVFGYRRAFLFSDMPKFTFRLFGKKVFAYDGARSFHDPSLIYRLDRDRLVIRVPLRLLKDPETIFVSTRNAKEELSLDFGSWRLLETAG